MRTYGIAGPEKIKLRQIEKPRVSRGHVLVNVAYCAFCNQTDMEVFKGVRKQPTIFGHEISGVVEKVGAGCARVKKGDKVLCLNKAEPASGYSEYILISEDSVFPAAPELDLKAVVLAETLAVVMKGVKKGLTWGDVACVFGLGPLGLWTVQVAARIACKVIGVDPISRRCDRACELGAVAAFPPSELAQGLTGLGVVEGVDVVFECTGVNEAFSQGLECLRPDGTLVVTGSHLTPTQVDLLQWECLSLNLFMTAFWPTEELKTESNTLALKLLETGVVDWGPMCTHVFPLEQLPEAIDLIRRRPEDVVKVLISV